MKFSYRLMPAFRPFAETMPAVTVCESCLEKGLPMARTHSPTSTESEFPKAATGRSLTLSFNFRTATSARVSVPIMSASMSLLLEFLFRRLLLGTATGILLVKGSAEEEVEWIAVHIRVRLALKYLLAGYADHGRFHEFRHLDKRDTCGLGIGRLRGERLGRTKGNASFGRPFR